MTYILPPGVVATDAYIPDRLIAQDAPPLVTQTVTIAAGQTLSRGSVLGKITASGSFVLALAAATDGSQTPNAVLAADVDTSGGTALTAPVYVAGNFNTRSMTFGTGITAASSADALRDVGIYLSTAQSGTIV